jgi:hypothetical protein
MRTEQPILASKLLTWTFMAYLGVLPMAGTIALRHLLMAMALLLAVFVAFVSFRHESLLSSRDLAIAWLPLLAWWSYLCVFPLISESPVVAWHSFRVDWLMSIGAGIIGLICSNRATLQGPSIFALGVACMVPVFVHWTLILFHWSGLLGPAAPLVMTWPDIWNALQTQWNAGWSVWVGHGSFLSPFRGFDPNHGNLGLAATQSVALLLPLVLTAWFQRNRYQAVLAFAGLALCLGSVVIAMSRGALIFCSLVVLSGLALQLLRNDWHFSVRITGFHGVVLAMIVGLGGLAIAKDPRWMLLNDKIQAAWMVEDPVGYFCNGPTLELEQRVRSSLYGTSPEHVDAVLAGLSGDGGRLLAARAGLDLVAEHPWGLDGSRHVFKHLIQEACDGVPKIEFAHSHNGWIDLLLALGWMGAGLYLTVFLAMMTWGFRRFRQNPSNPWAQALLLTLVFWLFRGLVDSVYREHPLMMQTALITYLAGRTWLTKT